MSGNEYRLPSTSLPRMNISDHLLDIKELQDFLDKLGIRTKNTRLERYFRYLELVNANENDADRQVFHGVEKYEFDRDQDVYLYVLREVHELMWILRGLKTHMPKGVEKNLDLIVGGQDFAAMDLNSSSRDAQFELRIASYFCQCG